MAIICDGCGAKIDDDNIYKIDFCRESRYRGNFETPDPLRGPKEMDFCGDCVKRITEDIRKIKPKRTYRPRKRQEQPAGTDANVGTGGEQNARPRATAKKKIMAADAKAAIMELESKGKNRDEISAITGINVDTVGEVILKAKRMPKTKDTEAEAVRLYREKMKGIDEIAKKLKITEPEVRGILERNGCR